MTNVKCLIRPAMLLAVAGLSGCSGGKAPEQREKVIPVKVITLAPSALTARHIYTGTVEESTAISLSFSMLGTVEEVLVAEGQHVQKGQLLATLNSATAQNSLTTTQSQLNRAQDAYDRLAKLHANGSLPDIKFVEVETGLQQAKSMVEIARKSLDDCRLYAPRSGIVASRSIEPGVNVMPGVAAFKLVTVDKVNVKIPVPESEIGDIAVGQDATIEVPALNNGTFTGKVELKGVTANSISHTYDVKIGVDNPQLRLMPGMVCKASLKRADVQVDIVIPNRTVQTSPDGKRFVWLADNGVARRRYITSGKLSGNGVAVSEGLSAGDQLIVEGYQNVSEGMKIRILE
ncbi:MAG: efflux RND transporter periplasmic adaptor subunit [Prevotellaceae bacterium]|jgi:RND family efflux transporter MFP subunit|nr:efflux RND transporter periplasmic adaptor subunit [Prevotellaceae bacterium]